MLTNALDTTALTGAYGWKMGKSERMWTGVLRVPTDYRQTLCKQHLRTVNK